MDKDLRSIQEAREAITRAKAAGELLAGKSQEELNTLVAAVARAGQDHARELAELAVEETGFGVVKHKEIKNRFAAGAVYRAIRDERVVGLLGKSAEKCIWTFGVPVGVIAALVPSTNPTSTVIYKTLIALKAGNPIVFSPHPNAVKCILRTVTLLRDAIDRAGGPKDAVAAVETPTLEGTRTLMSHPDTRLILATGGGAMVRAAYSSGTPAIGVGAGNGPAYFHESCDLPKAVKRVLDSKTFDNGTICASEQSVVVSRDFAPAVEAEFRRQGGCFLDGENARRLGRFLLRSGGTMNPEIVGKSVEQVARMAGLTGIPQGTRVLLAPEDGVGKGHPFSYEKLGLILAYYVEEDKNAALRRCVEILRHEGAGHTFSIHAEEERVIERFAQAVPASRIMVNSPSALGGIGATTNLFPALTLGCGAVGGSASSNNIGPLDLVNLKRVAWGVRELEELEQGGEETQWSRKDLSPRELETLLREVLRRLR